MLQKDYLRDQSQTRKKPNGLIRISNWLIYIGGLTIIIASVCILLDMIQMDGSPYMIIAYIAAGAVLIGASLCIRLAGHRRVRRAGRYFDSLNKIKD